MSAVCFLAALVLAILKSVGVSSDALDFGWLAVALIAAGLLLPAVPWFRRE